MEIVEVSFDRLGNTAGEWFSKLAWFGIFRLNCGLVLAKAIHH